MKRSDLIKSYLIKAASGGEFSDEQIEETKEFADYELMEDYNKERDRELRDAEWLARSITGGTHSLRNPFSNDIIGAIAGILLDADVVNKINKIIDEAPHIRPEDL